MRVDRVPERAQDLPPGGNLRPILNLDFFFLKGVTFLLCSLNKAVSWGKKETTFVLKTGMSFMTGRGPKRSGRQDFCSGADLRIGEEGKTRSRAGAEAGGAGCVRERDAELLVWCTEAPEEKCPMGRLATLTCPCPHWGPRSP